MSKEQYILEAQKQLEDKDIYKKLNIDPTVQIKKEVDEVVNEALTDGTIPQEVGTALT